MKRAEFIEKLKAVVPDQYVNWAFTDKDWLCSFFLDRCEELGMLPPSYDKFQKDESYVPGLGESGFVNEWESENEKK